MVDNSCKDGARSVSKMKKTEIGVIPEDWEVLDIQELINKNAIIGHLDGNHGALYPKSHEFVEDGIPYVGANALINGKIDFNKVKYLTKERANTFQKGISYPKDLLFAHNATVGPVAYVQSSIDKLILSTTLTYFRSDESKLKSKYLLYEFQTERFVKQYSSVMSQSTRNQVPITAQRKFNIVLPPLPEQEAIATALSDADAWIASLEQLIAKKRLIKQGAMQELLTPPSPSSGNADGEALEPWEVKKLGEMSIIYTGKKNNQDKIENGKYPFFVRSQTVERINSYSFNGEAILIPGEGNLGSIVHYINGKFDFNQRVYKISGFTGLHGRFLYFYFRMYFGMHAMQNTVKATVDSIRLPTLEEFIIKFPSLSEQERIATILSDMDAELEALQKQLDKAQQIKQGMMQELLTGRVRLV